MIKDIILYQDRILGVRLQEPQETEAGLILPETHDVYKDRVVVMKVGPGLMTQDGKLVPMMTFEGDYVQIQPMAGLDTIIDGVKYILFNERDIMMKLIDDDLAEDGLTKNRAHEVIDKLNASRKKLKVLKDDDFLDDDLSNKEIKIICGDSNNTPESIAEGKMNITTQIPIQGSTNNKPNYEQDTLRAAKAQDEK